MSVYWAVLNLLYQKIRNVGMKSETGELVLKVMFGSRKILSKEKKCKEK